MRNRSPFIDRYQPRRFLRLQKLFGLNPLPYYIFVLVSFGVSLVLIYRLARELLIQKKPFGDDVYGLSVQNFTRPIFFSLPSRRLPWFCSRWPAFWHFKTEIYFSYLFLFSLLSKETAVVLPLVLIILDWSRKS